MSSARVAVTAGLMVAAAGFLCAQTSSPSARERTLIAVFAHPDDEATVGPVLAQYAHDGVNVHLVLVTSGDKGVTPFAKIPAGEELAAVRDKEAQCAAAALGAQPPILLGLPDGGLADTALLAGLAGRLTRIFGELAPDAIVTWGPEGGYGHPDHRLVGAVVTQVVQAGGTSANLYYVGFPRSLLQDLGAALKSSVPFSPTADEHLHVRVRFSPEATARANAALRCHASQFTPETMDQLSALSERLLKGTAWLRSWNGGPQKQSLFD